MNTYDFDKTIFYPDSSTCFYKYCMKNHTAAVLKTLPKTAVKAVKYAAGKIKTKELKEQLFSFLSDIDDVDQAVESFWQDHYDGIGKWYLEQKKDDDIIISASPHFLLEPVCKKLGVRLIATPMDKKTGAILGENCHDSEKVRRFYEEFPNAHTENFYSDSLKDTPMARLAKHAWLVDRGRMTPWPED